MADTKKRIIEAALQIQDEDAKESNNLGFFARGLILATLPHRRVAGNFFQRKNGNYTLTMLAPPDLGLPFGTIPRLLITWLSTQAVKTRSRELELGDNLSEFMRELGFESISGGNYGSITRLREQTKRLFGTTIHASYITNEQDSQQSFQVVKKSDLFWQHKNPKQSTLWKSSILLSEEFYNEIIEHPIPLDLRAVKALKNSPLALDIYCWLTYRNSYLSKKTELSWEHLALQFGSDYKETRVFKFYFNKELRKVLTIYPEAKIKIQDDGKGLILLPSATHVKKNPT